MSLKEPPPDYSDSENYERKNFPVQHPPPYTISNEHDNWSTMPTSGRKDPELSNSGVEMSSQQMSPSPEPVALNYGYNTDQLNTTTFTPPTADQIQAPSGNCPNCGVGNLQDGQCTGSMIFFNLFFGIFGLLLIPFGACMVCIKCPPQYQCSHCKAAFEDKGGC